MRPTSPRFLPWCVMEICLGMTSACKIGAKSACFLLGPGWNVCWNTSDCGPSGISSVVTSGQPASVGTNRGAGGTIAVSGCCMICSSLTMDNKFVFISLSELTIVVAIVAMEWGESRCIRLFLGGRQSISFAGRPFFFLAKTVTAKNRYSPNNRCSQKNHCSQKSANG